MIACSMLIPFIACLPFLHTIYRYLSFVETTCDAVILRVVSCISALDRVAQQSEQEHFCVQLEIHPSID